jgi:hypothetical protein
MCPEAPRAGNSQRCGAEDRPDFGLAPSGFAAPPVRAARAASAASRARLEMGTSRSRPPLPRTATRGWSSRSAAVGSDTSSLARSPAQ